MIPLGFEGVKRLVGPAAFPARQAEWKQSRKIPGVFDDDNPAQHQFFENGFLPALA